MMKLLFLWKFAGVAARIESLPLASLGDFVRGRMGESTRGVEGLFESLLAESFRDELDRSFSNT